MKKFWKNTLSIMLLVSTALWFSGCNQQRESEVSETMPSENKLKVYTSFYPMYDFAEKIGGDKIELVNLVPVGAEPHDWEPTTGDIAELEEADMLIYNGAGMEHWVEDVVESLGNKELITVEASHGITLMEGHHHHHEGEEAHDHEHHEGEEAHDHEHHEGEEAHNHEHHEGEEAHDHEQHHQEEEAHDHDHGGMDPHVWTSIRNAKKEMENIKNALVQADPSNAQFYEENYEAYSLKFDELDQKFEKTLSSLPNKNIVVAHEAFGYLCADYGLHQFGIEGLSPESEPNPTRMAQVVDFVKEKGVKTIFFEELVSPKVAEAVAKETGATTDMLNPLEGLTQEQLDNGLDYLAVQEMNLTALEKALK